MTYKSKGGAAFSKREREVLRLGAEGATDQEISDRLSISVPTLRTYWLRIREKIGAVNRTHAIALAVAGSLANDEADPRRRILEQARSRGVANWAWRPTDRQIWLDEAARGLFGVGADEATLSLDRMLSTIWSADRPRFERFLSQSTELCPMTPIDARINSLEGQGQVVRTVNLSTHRSRQDSVTVLLASAITRAVSS